MQAARSASCAAILTLALAAPAWCAEVTASDTPRPGDFALTLKQESAAILYDPADYKVVAKVADMLAGDIALVAGKKPAVISTSASAGVVKAEARRVVLLGTLGHSPTLDALVASQHIDTSSLKNQWESYLVTRIPDVDGTEVLAVIGSDRRGTAYGATAISAAIGVSPWVWWADATPAHRDTLYLAPGSHGTPSVKYRGIFLNDEDWGLQPWAAKTFEPKATGGVGDIGPKTYAKIFELLLRLNANYCWPAMHNVTQAFNLYPDNKQVADDYAIVMGSSHCEQMLRNNVTEWVDAQGRIGEAGAASFNWVTNSAGITDYWARRLQENGKFENTYTLGLRGIHDSDMAGGGTPQQKTQRLMDIYGVQRDLLKKYVNPDVTRVPQLAIPYKEALTYYQNGAVPPEDVTLVWCDDNHGYIRQLSTPAEQKRSGGAGVYYHLSYWGRPHDYLWLTTTPPALVWEEMTKAYDYGARTLWVFNVGDIKPAELDITMALGLAYDINRYSLSSIDQFLQDFASRTFGPSHAGEIAEVMKQYYRLNYQRRPEHLGFNTSQNPGGPVQAAEFSDLEIEQRLQECEALLARANALNDQMPSAQRDAFYELVLYPVRGSMLQNQKMLLWNMNQRAAARGDAATATDAAERSVAAYDQIQKETAYFNDSLAGGKWKNMMSSNPHNQDVFRMMRYATAQAGEPATKASQIGRFTSVSTNSTTPVFYERNGYLSIAAEHFSTSTPRGGGAWKVIPGLGRVGDSVAVFPTTTPSIADPAALASSAPELTYSLLTETAGTPATLTVQAIPTHRINPERGLRYAVAIDNEAPQIVDLETPENSATWSTNVLRASAYGTTRHTLSPGNHTLHLYMVDPGVVLDHITLDLGGLSKAYLPPAEIKAEQNP